MENPSHENGFNDVQLPIHNGSSYEGGECIEPPSRDPNRSPQTNLKTSDDIECDDSQSSEDTIIMDREKVEDNRENVEENKENVEEDKDNVEEDEDNVEEDRENVEDDRNDVEEDSNHSKESSQSLESPEIQDEKSSANFDETKGEATGIGSVLFPQSFSKPSNYLQDLKRRKMEIKKQPPPIMKSTKFLKLLHERARLGSRSQSSSSQPSSPGVYSYNDENDDSSSQIDDVGDYSAYKTSGYDEEGQGEYDPDLMPYPGGLEQYWTLNQDQQREYRPMMTEREGLMNRTDLYQCHLCPVAFASPLSLKGHMSMHRIKKKFACSICSKSFAHSSTLNYHVRKHKGDLRYKCDQCGKKFLKPFRLKAHIRCVHSGEKPFECSYCEKKFSSKINLTRHIRVHTGEKPFLCLICGKGFRDNSSFALHRKYHNQTRRFECDVCGKRFVKIALLRTHKKCVHAEEKVHQCFLCEKTFAAKDYLRKHLMTHQAQKQFQCDFCDASYSRIGSLQKHRYLHTGEEPFKCEICGKGFRDQYTLSKHKKRHDSQTEGGRIGIKPSEEGLENLDRKSLLYECDKCERKFSLQGSLTNHKQKYCKGEKNEDGEEDYFCSACGMLFHHRQSLMKHMKSSCEGISNKKDKNFLCTTCGLIFTSRVSLNDHLRTSTCSGNEIPENYRCEICEATFSHRATLAKHRKLHGDVVTADEEKPKSETTPTRQAKVDENGRRIFECKHCNMTFRSKSALYDTHMRKFHGRPASEKKNECLTCGRKFHSKSDLRAHNRIHTGEKPFTCGICGKSFTQRGHVSMHMKIHTGQRDFPCTICGKAFQFATTLRNHVKLHTGERPNVCQLCGKGFIKSNNLKRHMVRHDKAIAKMKVEYGDDVDLSPYMRIDPDELNLTPNRKNRKPSRRSARRNKGESMKQLIDGEMSSVGNEEFFDPDVLVKEEPGDDDSFLDASNSSVGNDGLMDQNSSQSDVSLNMGTNFASSFEGKQFDSMMKEALSIELKCPFCSLTCPNAYHLAAHIKTHTGSKPFMCQDCGKSFSQAAHLRSHMQVHGKAQQMFKCIICDTEFNTSSELHAHTKDHKGEKPYGCYFCHKSYGRSQHLRRHVRSAHPDKVDVDMNMLHMPSSSLNDGQGGDDEIDLDGRRVYRCKYCEKSYSMSHHLRRHQRSSHPDKISFLTNKSETTTAEDAEYENDSYDQMTLSPTARPKTEIEYDSEAIVNEDTELNTSRPAGYSTPASLKSDENSQGTQNPDETDGSDNNIKVQFPQSYEQHVYVPSSVHEEEDIAASDNEEHSEKVYSANIEGMAVTIKKETQSESEDTVEG